MKLSSVGPSREIEVVVVEEDQLAKAESSGERSGLVRDAFHHVAVAHDAVGVMIDDFIAGLVVNSGKMLFGHRQADRHGESLSEGSGGDFDAICVVVLRVARGLRPILAEALQVVEGELISGKEKCSVNKCRGMAVGEHKAIAIGPLGVVRIVLHELVKEQVGDG